MIVPVFFAAACADPNAAPPLDNGAYQPADVVLRVESVGGFVPPDFTVTQLPTYSLYGDGRFITQMPQIAIYPGPSLPGLSVRTVSPAGIAQLVQLALDAGVGSADDLGVPGVADVPSTVFTVTKNGAVSTTSVAALGFDSGLSQPQVAARKKLSDFMDKLADLPGMIGAANAGEEKPYEPGALAVLADPWMMADPIGEQPQAEKAWPGPALPGPDLPGSPVPGMHCLTVTGAELPKALEAAAWPTNVLTPFVWEGQRYALSFRPLLPDESGCADLTR